MKVLVLFGSETGNAEELAFSLKVELQRNNFDCIAVSLEDFDHSTLPFEKDVIFITSTTGDGEFPLSMKSFWSVLLRKSLPPNCLNGLNFAVFGLGDSSYDKFNYVARKLHARISQLGGRELVTLGLGDDQGKYGLFTAYDGWLKGLKSALEKRKLSITNPFSTVRDVITVNDIDLNLSNNSFDDYSIAIPDSSDGSDTASIIRSFTRGTVLSTKVSQNTRLTAPQWNQDVRHLEFQIDSPTSNTKDLLYQPGDVAEVFYRNSTDLVKRALNRLLPSITTHNSSITSSDALINISRNVAHCGHRPSRVTTLPPLTLLQLFTSVLNINAIPKRSFFAAMAAFASDTAERDKLMELSSGAGTDLYFDYCIKEKRNFIEVLEEFPSVSPSLNALVASIPLVQPRQYSIASSAAVDNSKVGLCVAVVQYKTPYGRRRSGLCSSFLAALTVGDEVYLKLKQGGLRETALDKIVSQVRSVNSNSSGRLILIGPGTGVAPMRSIIQQYGSGSGGRESTGGVLSNSDSCPDSLPYILLLFGCRKQQSDYLYGSEWEELNSTADSGVKVVIAFSQDQANKDYVTHAIDRNSRIIAQLVQEGCGIFVAGSAKRMPADVKKALTAALNKERPGDGNYGESVITALIRSKKYVVEAWD